MRFAVVGDAPSVAGFIRAVARSPDHELAAFVFAPRLHSEMFALAPGARVCRSWEELLSDLQIGAVIVAGDDDQTLGAARQLAATGKALFVGPTAGQATNFAYELTLLQAEQEARLVPLFGLRAHPLVSRLRDRLTSGRIGAIRHVQLERRIVPAEAANTPSGCLSAADVAAAFLPDADLLRSIWGEYSQVTTVRSGDAATGISMETITLAGSSVPQVVWTATPAAGEPLWRLNVVGQLGTATLSGSPDDGSFCFENSAGGGPPERETMTFDHCDWLLREIPTATLTKPAALSDARALPAKRGLYPNWDDFTRAAELLDAAERSVRRRRTIEIHFETPSERGQFKTQMTAVGCSLLMFTLMAIVAYLTAASLVDMNVRVKQVLVALIFLPLGIFLAMQALLVLARPSAPPVSEKRGDQGPRLET
jgi:myo-inositol 2-dehydrogenase/D-chiro-inositol 1-dehydrogenase